MDLEEEPEKGKRLFNIPTKKKKFIKRKKTKTMRQLKERKMKKK